ncbi:H-type small acid-soluble spore protein [Bacillus solimangrovi]|uniref:Small, acid-soluble spore protein H n=1 Tax=Bacillus solimangrovi TaxID=1305675 RepID=A0A1E5LGQ9_9BACI|nr:H-type small acid-soluble spore protein [Bacillus solimangrovi]OEH93271.1 small, acid-soluble spore protein, H family [Bacillus solimangrovi]
MNIQRAKEIVESPETIEVLYNGTKIYIQNVDEKKDTARIFPLDQPSNETEVNVDQLIEP